MNKSSFIGKGKQKPQTTEPNSHLLLNVVNSGRSSRIEPQTAGNFEKKTSSTILSRIKPTTFS